MQQALLNVLGPIFEPGFHPSSYGYRPCRSPQQAVAKAERFMNRYGLRYVVDMDLSKCFESQQLHSNRERLQWLFLPSQRFPICILHNYTECDQKTEVESI